MKIVGLKVFLFFLHDERRIRIRIREAKNHVDPVDLDPDFGSGTLRDILEWILSFMLIPFWRYIYIILLRKKFMKSQNSRNQGFSSFFCLLIEGSRRQKNIRIQIRNTGFPFTSYLMRYFFLVHVPAAVLPGPGTVPKRPPTPSTSKRILLLMVHVPVTREGSCMWGRVAKLFN